MTEEFNIQLCALNSLPAKAVLPLKEGELHSIIFFLKLLLFKRTLRASTVCDGGRFISPKEYGKAVIKLKRRLAVGDGGVKIPALYQRTPSRLKPYSLFKRESCIA